MLSDLMQAEIRGLSETSFPMLKKFQKLKRNGLLTPPAEAATRVYFIFILVFDLF